MALAATNANANANNIHHYSRQALESRDQVVQKWERKKWGTQLKKNEPHTAAPIVNIWYVHKLGDIYGRDVDE
jgi:hypothetical protein